MASRGKGKSRKRKGQPSLLKDVSAEYRSNLKEFRRSVAALKKIGVAFQRTKPRKAKPSKQSKSILAEFAGLLTGLEKASKVSKKTAKQYSEAGFKVKNNRVILEAPPPGAKQYTRAGRIFVKETMQGGAIKREIPPIASSATVKGRKKLAEWIETLPENPIWEEARRKKQYVVFTFYGKRSRDWYNPSKPAHMKQLQGKLLGYTSIEANLAASRKKQVEVIQQFEFATIERDRAAAWTFRPADRHQVHIEGHKRYNPDRRQLQWEREAVRYPARHKATLEKNRKRAAAWRAAKRQQLGDEGFKASDAARKRKDRGGK